MNINKATLLAGIGDMTAGVLASCTLHLFTAYDGTTNPAPGSFTESQFTGYSDSESLNWEGPRVFPDNTVGNSFLASYQGANAISTSQVSENVLGWYAVDGSSNVVMFDYFVAPVPMLDVDSFLNFTGQFNLDPTMAVGGTVVS